MGLSNYNYAITNIFFRYSKHRDLNRLQADLERQKRQLEILGFNDLVIRFNDSPIVYHLEEVVKGLNRSLTTLNNIQLLEDEITKGMGLNGEISWEGIKLSKEERGEIKWV